ncbi:MAG TPA: hypothetical protein VKT81_17665 [Bryobacteraceae bacterium]|nr:hypothetical protein [Bryobacteraceae bacterium]
MSLSETATRTGETLSRAQEQVKDLGKTAVDKLDEARVGTAEALESAASSVRTKGRSGAKKIESMSEQAAETLDSTAQYMRAQDVGTMLGNLKLAVGRNPGAYLLFAAGVGFLAGAAIRRGNSREHA